VVPPGQQVGLTTTSTCVSHGIRVTVRSFFIPAHSSLGPASRYLFGYNVTITNEGERVMQLRNRHWVITDELGRMEEVGSTRHSSPVQHDD
jgi:ApaG protein